MNTFNTRIIITLFYVLISLLAYTQSVQIGTAENNAGAYPVYSPVYRFSSTSATTNVRSNILFTQAELSAAGLPAGATITSVEFKKVVNGTSFITPADLKLYMGNSNNTSLLNSTTWAGILSTHSLVYSNSSFNLPSAEGWVQWNVTPFVYTGGALEIATDLIMGGSGATNGYWSWQFDASTPANLIIGQTGTGNAPSVLNGSNANYLHRPNIKINYTTSSLPISIIKFNGLMKDSKIYLNWQIAEETDIQKYEVEFGTDGKTFSHIKTIHVSGLNSYTLTDTCSYKAAYYRLKIIRKDGLYTYSAVIRVNSIFKADAVEVYPLPFTDMLCFNVQVTESCSLTLKLYNLNGIPVKHRTAVATAGTNLLVIDGLKQLPAGVYIAEIDNGTEQIRRMVIK